MSRSTVRSSSSSSQLNKSSARNLNPITILRKIAPRATFDPVKKVNGANGISKEATLNIENKRIKGSGKTNTLAKESTAAKALTELWDFTFETKEGEIPKIVLSAKTVDKIDLSREAGEKLIDLILGTYANNLPIEDGYLEKNFNFRKHLGKGAYGWVHEAQNKLDNINYAIKIIKLRIYEFDSETINKKRSEVISLAGCQHENIIQYFRAWFEIGAKALYDDSGSLPSTTDSFSDYSTENAAIMKRLNKKIPSLNLYIQTELCSGNLQTWLDDRKMDDMHDYKIEYEILKSLVTAIDYIHSKNIMHRDIKPNNILTIEKSNELKVKLGDFGLAREIIDFDDDIELTSQVGNKLYAAPEIETGKYDFSSDIYSLGVITLQLFLYIPTQQELVKIIKDLRSDRILPEKLQENDPNIAKFVKQMVQIDATKRPRASDIISSVIFSQFKKDDATEMSKEDIIKEKDKEIHNLKLKLQEEKDKNSKLSKELDDNLISKIDTDTYVQQLEEKTAEIDELKALIKVLKKQNKSC